MLICWVATMLLASRTEPLVTCSIGPVSAHIALPMLGKAAGLKMAASDSVASDVLMIHVRNAPLSAVKTKIAAVTAGKWLVTGDSEALVSAADGNDLEPRDRQAFQSALLPWIKSQTDALKRPYCSDRTER